MRPTKPSPRRSGASRSRMGAIFFDCGRRRQLSRRDCTPGDEPSEPKRSSDGDGHLPRRLEKGLEVHDLTQARETRPAFALLRKRRTRRIRAVAARADREFGTARALNPIMFSTAAVTRLETHPAPSTDTNTFGALLKKHVTRSMG